MKILLGPDSLVLHDPDDRDSRRVFTFTGWDETAEPDTLLVPNGGGHGAVDVGTWTDKEKYLTVGGRAATTDRASFLAFRKALLAALPLGEKVPLVVEEHAGLTLQMFVRRFGKVEPTWRNGRWTDYVLQAVAPIPRKYALAPLTGQMGVWTGDAWFRRYTDDAGTWVRRYTDDAGTWVRRYEQDLDAGDLPDSVVLDSAGETTSEEVVVEVTGPVTAGDWHLLNEATGDIMWADLTLTAEQTLRFDSAAKTLTLNGAPVDRFMFGNWLTLPPGQSVWRLVSGTDSAAFASVTAFEAYE